MSQGFARVTGVANAAPVPTWLMIAFISEATIQASLIAAIYDGGVWDYV
jgi:hypothetical protein